MGNGKWELGFRDRETRDPRLEIKVGDGFLGVFGLVIANN